MTKQDKIFAILRKLDSEWSKRGKTFCQVVKEFTNNESNISDISDDEIIENIKNIFPDEKEIK